MFDDIETIAATGLVAAAIAASWLLPPKARPFALIGGGAGLLGVLSWPSLLCLAAATIATWCTGRLSAHRLAATLSIGGAIAALYLALLWRSELSGRLHVAVPLGMAYYLLRLLHYAIEAERDNLRPHSLVDYGCYQFFPATLPIGPINRFDDFLRDLRRRRWDSEQVAGGASRILTGLAMVVLVGQVGFTTMLAPHLRAWASGSPVGSLYVDTLIYWCTLYIQFSGYSSIAIGVGALAGFTLPENFNWPIVSRNIGEFWRRWHMTLSAWCRDYVYVPVLALWRLPVLASVMSMLVLGLWHQISLHYLIWGIYHGLGLAAWRRFDAAYEPIAPRLPGVVRGTWTVTAHVMTLHFVMFSYPVANAIEKLVLGR